jgi:probable F420-dependent oxidoreductase
MAKIEFGTGLRAPTDVASFSRYIEDLGFDYLTCGEHVMFHGPVANGLVSLSVAAGATKRIKLLSSITLVPLYPAALLAKMTAAIDVASGGRFELGVGVGGEFPKEFDACGVPVGERGARTDEALEILHRVWTEEKVSFDGRFTKLDEFTIQPRPIQQPRPPIWVAGRKDAAMRRTARYADGWMPYMYTPEQLHESLKTIRKYGEDLGRDMSDFRPGVFIFTAVHEDPKRGFEMANELLSRQYAQDFTKLVPKYALAGDPESCQARLREYIDAGAEMVIVTGACPDDYLETNLDLIAGEILPAFR